MTILKQVLTILADQVRAWVHFVDPLLGEGDKQGKQLSQTAYSCSAAKSPNTQPSLTKKYKKLKSTL